MITLNGKIWKDGKLWLVEAPDLDLMTQGKSKKNALCMIKDAIEGQVDVKGFEVDVAPRGNDQFVASVSNDRNATLLIALMLKRMRAKQSMSLANMRDHLKVKSRSNYAQYEKGRNLPSFPQIEHFFNAMGLEAIFNIRLAQKDMAPIDIVVNSTKREAHTVCYRRKR